jgi:uncharacterized pyridoxamine 5'-phosphate oxidase family protein
MSGWKASPVVEISMTRDQVIDFLRRHRLAVEATVAPDGAPQAAVIGVAISEKLELVFDTVETTRKYRNMRVDPRIALVVGWDEITVQIAGVADFPEGPELDRIRECYFLAYPEGRERLTWPGISHVRVRPIWVRYSDYTQDPPRIVELGTEHLA